MPAHDTPPTQSFGPSRQPEGGIDNNVVAFPGVAPLPAPNEGTDSSEYEPGHPAMIDWKFGIRLPGRAVYLNIRLDSERRDSMRLRADGQIKLPVTATIYTVTSLTLFCLFGMVCCLYLLKSVAGINLFTGTSPLHPIYGLFFE